ncbi:MAG: hypothetical protein MSH15_12445 [Oscillospiraceae bacterium]|nr:hypothetical protein [Oscillospiraceae bacterium]
MNKSNAQKYITVIAMLLVVIGSLIRYYILNDSFKVQDAIEKEFYMLNESVDIGENKCNDFDMHPGWSFKIIDSEIYEFDEFCKKYNLSEIYLDNTPKILEVNLKLTNISNELNSIRINFFEVVGIDWYTTLNYELTHYANSIFFENCEEENMGLALYPNTSFEIKMIYNLNEWQFSKEKYKNLNKEKMYFELTILPVNKLIEFR